MMTQSVWVVEAYYEDENPGTYGPYTKRQAERIAEALRKEAEQGTDRHGTTHHPYGLRNALAVPLRRYDAFVPIGSDEYLTMCWAVRAVE